MNARATIVLLLLPLSACTLPVLDGVNYSSSASLTQKIPVKNAKTITIKCYCRSYTVIRNYEYKDIRLKIDGTFSIAGYHGSAEDAGAVPLKPEGLAFKVSRKHDSLTLKSPEWVYIHHSLYLDKLVVLAPDDDGIQVNVEQQGIGELTNNNS
jgi:hypothetical protein